jgi:hypothetical protein
MRLKVFYSPAAQVVDDPHLRATLYQGIDQVRTDKGSSPGN